MHIHIHTYIYTHTNNIVWEQYIRIADSLQEKEEAERRCHYVPLGTV